MVIVLFSIAQALKQASKSSGEDTSVSSAPSYTHSVVLSSGLLINRKRGSEEGVVEESG